MSIWTTPQRMRGISESASPKVAESFQSLYIRCISVSSNQWIVKIHLRERGADPKHPSLKHIFWPIAKIGISVALSQQKKAASFFGTFWLEKNTKRELYWGGSDANGDFSTYLSRIHVPPSARWASPRDGLRTANAFQSRLPRSFFG